MSHEFFRPDRVELENAKKEYATYLAGVLILHNPEETAAIHNSSLSDPEKVVGCALQLAKDGLQGLIRYCNPKESRSPLSELQHGYFETVALAFDVVHDAYEDPRFLARIQPEKQSMLRHLQPLPISNQTVYWELCESRTDKLKPSDFLDGVVPHESLFEYVNTLRPTQLPSFYTRTAAIDADASHTAAIETLTS